MSNYHKKELHDVEFEAHPFAEGRFKVAFKGTFLAPPSKAGMACVVKRNKNSDKWDPTNSGKATVIHEKAEAAAKSYSEVLTNNHYNCSIRYTNLTGVPVPKVGNPHLSEHMLVEEYLPGEFTKWTNNFGFISPNNYLMPAFMHWSWCNSGGNWMIADLQGVRTSREQERIASVEYVLTDPAIMSNTVMGGEYGCTDTGVEGIAKFFLNHKCNRICNTYRRPDNVPNITEANPLQSQFRSTRYSHELTLSEDVRIQAIQIFSAIGANRQW